MAILKKYIPQLLIMLSVWLVYGNTLNHQFAGDDIIVISENDRVQNGLKDIPSFFKNIKSEQTQHRYGYRPIALLSFAFDVELHGLNPFWFHFGNLVYYSILCLLIFHFLTLIFPSTNRWLLLFITLLFAVHPLHTEVVANIKSRDEILAMIFGVSALIQLWKWNLRSKNKYLLLALIFSILGFFSKENTLSYLLFGLFLPVFLPKHSIRQKLEKALPAFLIMIALLVIYGIYQIFIDENSIELAQKGIYHEDRYSANPLVDSGILQRMTNAFMLILLGLKLFLIPHPLVHDYGTQVIKIADSIFDFRVILCVIIMASLAYTGIKFRKQKPPILFGFLFFTCSLAIYLHVPIAGPDLFGERFLFGPILGLLIIGISLFELAPKKLIYTGLSIVTFVFSGLTFQRAKAWKSTEVLFETDKKNLQSCARFQYNYASMLHLKYYDAAPQDQIVLKDQILFHYEKSVVLTDRILKAYLDLGSAYMEFGYDEKALQTFQECAEKYNDLSPPFLMLCKYYMSHSDYETAKRNIEISILNGDQNGEYYYLKAVCEIKLDQLSAAKSNLEHGRMLSADKTKFDQLLSRIP